MSRREAEERLHNLVVDPIGTSLRATNGSNTSKPFQDLSKEEDVYSLYDARTLDVWEGPQGSSARLEEHQLSKKLPPRLFEPDSPHGSTSEKLVFRLLVTHPIMDTHLQAWHDDLSETGQKQIDFLPFEPESMKELITRFHLPEHWAYLRKQAREVGNFHRETSWDFTKKDPVGTRLGIVIHFPFVLRPARQLHFIKSEKYDEKGNEIDYRRKYQAGKWNTEYYPHRDDPFVWSFAMSHNLQDGRTRGLLDGLTDVGLRSLRDELSPAGKPGWYEHPLDLPAILLEIYCRHTQWEINQLAADVSNFEEAAKGMKLKEIDDFDDITTQLAFLERSLDFEKNLAQSLLDTLQYLEEKIFPKALEEGGSRSHTAFIQRTNPQMHEKLTNIASMIMNNLHTCTYFQSRTQDALEYINALLNRDDQDFNKKSIEYQNMGMETQLKDAEANKTISIMTMTFLPTTAVAAICSMNVFDWQQPDKVRVSRHFWIFWVVSIICTACVLGIFFAWKHKLHRKVRARELAEEEEQEKRASAGEEDEDLPKHRGSRQGDGNEQPKSDDRFDGDEKDGLGYEREVQDERRRSSRRRNRRKSRRRSHSKRSRNRDRHSGQGFQRTASQMGFRGESSMV